MASPQKPKVMVMVSAALAVLGVAMAAFLSLSAAPEQPSAQVAEGGPSSPSAPAHVDSAPPIEPPREQAGSATAQPTRPPGPAKPNRLARDLEREKIWRALGRKHGLEPAVPGSAAPSEAAAALLPSLDANYVRDSIREQLVPVAVDCYDTVLGEDADASGTLVFEFTIIGDEEVGGVVEAVELGDDSTLESEFLRECLRESLLAVTFPAPTDGGRVEVRYPMSFTPD